MSGSAAKRRLRYGLSVGPLPLRWQYTGLLRLPRPVRRCIHAFMAHTSTIITAVQLLFASQSQTLVSTGMTAQALGYVVLLVASFRTTLAILRLVTHKGEYDTLPFLSPLLWTDWVSVTDMLWVFSPVLGAFGIAASLGAFGMCFWLCIGYTQLGYGTRQYTVLDVPDRCEHLPISYQTDPRRYIFLSLHNVIFSLAILGFATAAVAVWKDNKVRYTAARTSADIYRQPPLLQTKVGRYLGVGVSLFVLVPTTIATIVAGVVNAHTYLVLGQQNCYASFVSSRLGYLDAYLADISVSVTVCEVTEPKSQD